MASRDEVDNWIAAYERAWRTAGTEPLADLFAEDGSYRMSPYEEPTRGLAQIAALWERERRGADANLISLFADAVSRMRVS